MRNQPVHWYEGMFLRPQHFQAADRYFTELVATGGQWDNPYNYGLRSIELSREALANFHLQITQCRARLPDGTLVALGTGNEPDRVNLKPAFENHAVVTAYLAVSKRSLGRGNVGNGRGTDCRFREKVLSLQDESAGGNDQEIQLLDLNVRVLLSTDDATGYDVLPIARIKRAGSEGAIPEIDDDYIPPVLAVDAWPPLRNDYVRAVYDIIGEKIEVLGDRVVQRGINLTSQEPGDLDDLFLLTSLNTGYATLGCLAFAQAVHPLLAYTELCRIVGALSIFDPTRRIDAVPAYDHDDLARIFKWVRLRIEQLLGARKKLDYVQRYFVGTDRGMQVTIDPQWLHSGWQWFVGVLAQNISESLCRELLRPGKLDWKMGSSQQVDLIFKHGVPGVEQIELPDPPRALPARQGWVYYQVRREGAAWKDVLATQTLALRFKMELIGNPERLPGQQQLEVLVGDKRALLQFALFAVPPAL